MNFTPNSGEVGNTYSLRVCVKDKGLPVTPDNISLCAPASAAVQSACDDFTLTVTNANRAPEISNQTPATSTITTTSTQDTKYFADVSDPDGTIPDINWIVDGSQVKHEENKSNDTFTYNFGCGVSGPHTVKILTTDGLLNTSYSWDVNVEKIACSSGSSGGGGGGGSGGGASKSICTEKWECSDWHPCQSVQKAFASKSISIEDYVNKKDLCAQRNITDEKLCGFQTTTCHNINNCSNNNTAKIESTKNRVCYFRGNENTLNKSNSCSNGKKDNEELGVDCGGPCPNKCKQKTPIKTVSNLLKAVALSLVILILAVSLKLFFLWKKRAIEQSLNTISSI